MTERNDESPLRPSGHHGHHHRHLHQEMPSDPALRVKALESVLVEKGLVRPEAIDAWIETYETNVGPHNGARVVARAWTDPAFRKWLLADGAAAIGEMELSGLEATHVTVLENTPDIHNMVVCTLCSCYPWSLLGLPPVWYKSAPYRSRAVLEPRGVLREFGLDLGEDIEIRVWDSTAEIRYLVLPERPGGTQGMTAEQLAGLVTRDSMIGVARLAPPAA